MGTPRIRAVGIAQIGARGAYTEQDWRRLKQTVGGLLNYYKASKSDICGFTYGSDKIFIDQDARRELQKQAAERYMQDHGTSMPFTIDEVQGIWTDTRKGRYKDLRDGKPIENTSDDMPLFGVERDEPVSVIYAYWGQNQIAGRRLVKIGYTSQDLQTYLNNLRRQYDPKLLATKPGGRVDEQKEHLRYRGLLAEGREWFEPSRLMLADFRSTWKTVPHFDLLCDELIEAIDQ